MSDGNVDRIPVNQLVSRYNLARSAVYRRLADLGIEREKIGNRAYINAEQLALLDELHEFIQIGGNVAEFIARKGLTNSRRESSNNKTVQSSDRSSALAFNEADMIKLIRAIASEIASEMQPADPLAYYESLERAASRGWKLRTSELANLLELDPAEINSYGQTFYEAGFVFSRSGYRSGGEVAWKVSKG